jgi:hypothetical protein
MELKMIKKFDVPYKHLFFLDIDTDISIDESILEEEIKYQITGIYYNDREITQINPENMEVIEKELKELIENDEDELLEEIKCDYSHENQLDRFVDTSCEDWIMGR